MKKSLIVVGISITSFFIFSSVASAQVADAMKVSVGIGSIAGLIQAFTQTVVKALGTLFMAAAMVAFFWGIVQYIWGSREGNETKIKNGNTFIKWSLLALFVMFSVYGIIRFGQTFICGGPCTDTITIPDINFGKPSDRGTGTSNPDPLGQTYYCPDGITKYYKPSDMASVCNNSTTYTCPNGTKYYNQSDYRTVCGSGGTSNSGGGGTFTAPNTTNGTVTQPPASGCTYDEFGNQICAADVTP